MQIAEICFCLYSADENHWKHIKHRGQSIKIWQPLVSQIAFATIITRATMNVHDFGKIKN